MALQSSFSSSSSSPHPFSSSSIRYKWKYDVFISFRGTDTRLGFTGNLYNALRKKGIHTFFDDDQLQSGEEITPSLLKAIQESRIAIIVLSSNYAHSSFCLEELVHILDCIKGNNRLVMPVFYEVDPSDVRRLKNSFGKAMAKHKSRSENDVEKWENALKEVANLSGYHFKRGEEYEHKFIEKIVQHISRKISRVPLPVADYPVGLESRVSEVISLLEMDSTDRVHMVGIHGIGGIGKTTLAAAIYNFIADNFDGVCFLENVRENSQKHGLVHLQKDLLPKILGKEGVHITGVKEGTSQIQRRLSQMKVLLVLDDVDDSKQLEAIAGEPDWFGGGSRVIITTRDTHLLKLHGVKRTYCVHGLNSEESFELLIWKAFKTNTVSPPSYEDVSPPSYEDVLNRAITYSSGHPLALQLIGSNLFDKEVQVWESALDEFEKHLDDKIYKILRVSFDGLGRQEQSVFLDIACCFKGYPLEEINFLLQAHYGRSVEYHIGVLVQKSLITFGQYDTVTMHDLIEEMGKEIDDPEKSAEMPGKRRRLGFYKDVVEVLEHNRGTSTIEIIILEFPSVEDAEVKWDGTAFKEMKNLKILIIKNGYFSESPKHLPNSLRVLEWRKYPSDHFPPDFQPEMLCILNLPNYVYPSAKLDSISKNLASLKFDDSYSLKEIPDVSSLKTLLELSFRNCKKLVTVDSSVGFLPNLKILNAEDCDKLRNFPPVIQWPSLEKLELSGCKSLEYFPEIQQEIENVKELELIDTGIKDLPSSFRNFSRLEALDINGDEMCKLPIVIGMMPQLLSCVIHQRDKKKRISGKLKDGFEGILTHSLPSQNLTSLILPNRNLSDGFFPLAVSLFPNVERLDLTGNDFAVLPECIQKFCFLKHLIVDDCKHLREIRGLPPKMTRFSAVNCQSLSHEAKGLLLDQGLYQGRRARFVMPGERIPSWFERRRSGFPFTQFWFRGTELHANSLCFAILLKDHITSIDRFETVLIINGRKVDFFKVIKMGQLLILNMDSLPNGKNGWNCVRVTFQIAEPPFTSESIVKEIGTHVFKQKSSSVIQDIQFTDPHLMTELIIMMMMVSIVFPNHKKQPLLRETCIGLWTLLSLTHWYFWKAEGRRFSFVGMLGVTARMSRRCRWSVAARRRGRSNWCHDGDLCRFCLLRRQA